MKSILRLIIILAIGPAAWCSIPKCAALASAPPHKLIEFLKKGSTTKSDPYCVEHALRRLGDMKEADAIPAIVSYLDFHRAETDMEKMGFGGQLGTIGNDFPASLALAQIGKVALVPLAHVIGSGELSELARSNGIYTISRILHSDLAATRFLRSESDKARTPSEQARLLQAAKDAARMCSDSERAICEEAALGNRD